MGDFFLDFGDPASRSGVAERAARLLSFSSRTKIQKLAEGLSHWC
jgi:hypothetical protein